MLSDVTSRIIISWRVKSVSFSCDKTSREYYFSMIINFFFFNIGFFPHYIPDNFYIIFLQKEEEIKI